MDALLVIDNHGNMRDFYRSMHSHKSCAHPIWIIEKLSAFFIQSTVAILIDGGFF